jgi:hypothetical protein
LKIEISNLKFLPASEYTRSPLNIKSETSTLKLPPVTARAPIVSRTPAATHSTPATVSFTNHRTCLIVIINIGVGNGDGCADSAREEFNRGVPIVIMPFELNSPRPVSSLPTGQLNCDGLPWAAPCLTQALERVCA